MNQLQCNVLLIFDVHTVALLLLYSSSGTSVLMILGRSLRFFEAILPME